MMAARANWKGFIKFGEVRSRSRFIRPPPHPSVSPSTRSTAQLGIASAANLSIARPALRSSGTNKSKAMRLENGEYVVLEPEEVASAVPGSDKTLKIEAFVPFIEIDDVYFDKPYYLMPDKMVADAFKLLRDGMRPGQGRRPGAQCPLPSPAHSADPPSRQWSDRHDVKLRL